MNLENNYQIMLDAIMNGERDIAIFVVDGVHYYIFDSKDNYCIDVRPEYEAYISRGWMDKSSFDEAISLFRGGIPVLTKNTFRDYVKIKNVQNYSSEWMRSLFLYGRDKDELTAFYKYIENYLATLTEPVASEWDGWRMRLPKFYINFDKKIYRHTDWGREHEAAVPGDWNAQENSDFGLLVPDDQQYWIIDGMNFWKLQL